MAAIDAIRLTAMLVLSALVAVLVVAGLASGAADAAHAMARRAPVSPGVDSGARAGMAPLHGMGRAHAQRGRSWSVARGRQPRAVRSDFRSTGSRS